MSIYTEYLKKADANVKAAMSSYDPEAMGGSFSPVPTGEYKMGIVVALDLSKEHKKLMLIWQFTILEGDFAERKITDRNIVDGSNEIALHIARHRFEDCGIEWPEDFKKIEKSIDLFNEKNIIAECKLTSKPQANNPEYTDYRIYIKSVVDGEAVENETGEVTEAEAEGLSEDLQTMQDFCSSHDIEIEITNENTIEEVVETLVEAGAKFTMDELTDDEKAFLESVAPALIDKPKAKAKLTLGKKK